MVLKYSIVSSFPILPLGIAVRAYITNTFIFFVGLCLCLEMKKKNEKIPFQNNCGGTVLEGYGADYCESCMCGVQPYLSIYSSTGLTAAECVAAWCNCEVKISSYFLS